MIKLKHILTEKREFPADGITVISLATDRNEHTKARLTLAKVMKNKKFIGIYKAIENIQEDVKNENFKKYVALGILGAALLG